MPRAVVLDTAEQVALEHRYLFEWPMADRFSDASCRDQDLELFFPLGAGEARKEAAAQVCRSCLVQVECLDFALKDPSLHGVWGGTDETDRVRLRRVAV